MARATFPKRIEVIDNAPAGLWNVSVDLTQLHQVVLNLCVNARDAIDGPGKIILGAENLELKDSLGAIRGPLAAGSYVKLSVSDSGTGMPPSVAAKIFDPLFSTKAPGKGTNLGLSTVAMIVDGLGGAIDLETGEGKGTTFSIYLPALPEAESGAAAATNELRHDGAGRRVLIADDEVAVAAIMREMLESVGYRAQTAASGLEPSLSPRKSSPISPCSTSRCRVRTAAKFSSICARVFRRCRSFSSAVFPRSRPRSKCRKRARFSKNLSATHCSKRFTTPSRFVSR
jgi:hypothetical protein